MLSPVIHGLVKDGKFVADDLALFRKAFYCHEGKAVELQVKRYRKVRSLNQNAYYWGVVIPMIGNAMGETDIEAVHEVIKHEHHYYIATVGKSELHVPLSTADLSTLEFEQFLEKVRRWASEFFSLYIPLPNEVTL
jgi:hypothetical protein